MFVLYSSNVVLYSRKNVFIEPRSPEWKTDTLPCELYDTYYMGQFLGIYQ